MLIKIQIWCFFLSLSFSFLLERIHNASFYQTERVITWFSVLFTIADKKARKKIPTGKSWAVGAAMMKCLYCNIGDKQRVQLMQAQFLTHKQACWYGGSSIINSPFFWQLIICLTGAPPLRSGMISVYPWWPRHDHYLAKATNHMISSVCCYDRSYFIKKKN